MSASIVCSSRPSFRPAGRLQPAAGAAFFPLATGQAVTLRARRASLLRVARGRVWVTVNASQPGWHGPSPMLPTAACDHFLGQGEGLVLLPGQTLVMEALTGNTGNGGNIGSVGCSAPASFSWEPLPAGGTAPL